jgi:hypothetical protein
VQGFVISIPLYAQIFFGQCYSYYRLKIVAHFFTDPKK